MVEQRLEEESQLIRTCEGNRFQPESGNTEVSQPPVLSARQLQSLNDSDGQGGVWGNIRRSVLVQVVYVGWMAGSGIYPDKQSRQTVR